MNCPDFARIVVGVACAIRKGLPTRRHQALSAPASKTGAALSVRQCGVMDVAFSSCWRRGQSVC